MSASDKEGPKRPPDSPTTPPGQRLRERVSFFEKVWSGGKSGVVETVSSVDVEEFERRLAEERLRNAERGRLEPVALRHTPRHVVHTHEVRPDGSIQETVTTTTEEGDLGSGVKTVKFEKVTVRKSVRTVSSRTPSEELLLEDSAYLTQSNGNLATSSKTSSISSLTGRFPSEESLRRTPSRERLNRDEWDNASNSSKVTSSSSEWYSEYRTQSFQSGSSKLEYVRSKSQYDEHIASIRGQGLTFYSHCLQHSTPVKILINANSMRLFLKRNVTLELSTNRRQLLMSIQTFLSDYWVTATVMSPRSSGVWAFA
ncbi:hypothetical protein TcasGA2_TC034350 [Tribolium castaneum]|uniref:Uncharacterized protein n=1 Tax=Tribolium castaneum TaxID=7070 RepID=A0A139WB45_TRICA|nr:hypothetical protein TcasGA2_TC034350 [Tribolium castaneum]